ncbi:MAG: PEP-CTERM sorting domain-containing protein [Planctomycetota bacterium]
MRTYNSIGLAALIIALAGASANAASILGGYQGSPGLPDPVFDRFANSSQFHAADYDFSPVGRDSLGRWATLIHPQIIISANHFAAEGTVTFHETNDPTGMTYTGTVVDGLQIGNTDLFVGKLSEPMPAQIQPYPIAGINNYDSDGRTLGGYADVEMLLVGRSPAGNVGGVARTDFVVGRNRADIIMDLRLEGTLTEGIGFFDDSVDGDLQDPLLEGPNAIPLGELYVQSGDSGAPTFVSRDGKLELVGIHLGNNMGATRRYSVDSFVPFYGTQINDAIVQLVPEPSSHVLMLIALTGLAMLRRQ